MLFDAAQATQLKAFERACSKLFFLFVGWDSLQTMPETVPFSFVTALHLSSELQWPTLFYPMLFETFPS